MATAAAAAGPRSEATGASATRGASPTPLRRATYVDVDHLVRSQYDVDPHRFASELAKARQHREQQQQRSGDASGPPGNSDGRGADATASGSGGGGSVGEGVDGTDSTTSAAPTSSVAAPSKPTNAWAGTNMSVLPGSSFRSPLTHARYHHQSRLQPPKDGFNLCLLVGKVELVVDKCRVDGSRVLVAEVEVGDATGSLSLRARDEQIDVLRKVSEQDGAIVLRNCTMELYQGKHLRLAVSKWGKMSPYPDGIKSTPPPPTSMNYEHNFSLVDLNLIAMTKVPNEPPFPMPMVSTHHKQPKQQRSKQHHQYQSPKHHYHYEDSPSRGRGTSKNRGRSHGGGGGARGGHYISVSQQKMKRKDDWHLQSQHHRGGPHSYIQQQQHGGRPRSGSHNVGSASGQYVLQHQTSGGSGSPPPQAFASPPMQYLAPPRYDDGSVGGAYPYGSGDRGMGTGPPPGSPHSRPSPQQQFLPEDHYKRQQALMFQQYELQQRHAHQMAMLQQQQESQRRMLEQQHHRHQQQGAGGGRGSSLIPELGGAGSQEASPVGAGYGNVPPPPPPAGLHLGPGAFPSPHPSQGVLPMPASPTQPPLPLQPLPPPHGMAAPEYTYGVSLSSPMGAAFQGGGELGQQQQQQQQQRPSQAPASGSSMSSGGGSASQQTSTYATIISPPTSPVQDSSHPAPTQGQYPEGL